MEPYRSHELKEDLGLMVEVLLHEKQSLIEDNRKADQQVFKLITVLVVPFLALLGYSLFNPMFSPVLLTVPFFSILSIMVIASIFTQYGFDSLYGEYLNHRLTEVLGKKLLIGEDLGRIYYSKGFTIVNVGLAMALIGIVAINISLIIRINEIVMSNIVQQSLPFPLSVREYWILVMVLCIVAVISIINQYTGKVRQCKKYIASNEATISSDSMARKKCTIRDEEIPTIELNSTSGNSETVR